MKKIILLILLGLISSCNKKNDSEIIVNSNHENKKIYLIASKDNLSFKNHSKVLDSTFSDKNGNFSFKLKHNKSNFYQLKVQQGANFINLIYNVDIFLIPGDKVNIKIGSLPEIKDRNLLNSLQIKLDSLFKIENKLNKNKYLLSIKNHEERIKKHIKKLNDFLMKNSYDLPKKYKQYLYAKIKLKEINENLEYLKYHNYYSGIGEGMQYVSIDSIPKHWKLSIDSQLNDFYFLDTYKNYISGLINHKFEVFNSVNNNEDKWDIEFESKINIIKNELTTINRDIAFYTLSDNFWQYLATSSTNFYSLLEKLDTYFAKNYSNLNFYQAFKKSYKNYTKIAPGEKAPNLSLKALNGKNLSLQDFIGNVIYLDFWGTWCAPCIKSIPKHLELQKKYKNKNVKFIYVALEGKDDGHFYNKWKTFLEKKKFKGIHLIAKNQFNNTEIAPYLVSSAPTYVLINKEGKIVLPRADGPSGISKSIDKLLN